MAEQSQDSSNENQRLGGNFVFEASHREEAKASQEQVGSDDRLRKETHRGGEAQPGSSPSSAATSTVAPTTVASLIQSAARISILNMDRPGGEGVRRQSSTNNTHQRLFQDDEYDDLESSPSLKSLQKKTLPAIPDEQDRKRFVGCLAAVIASLYDYDDDQDDSNETKSQQKQGFDATMSNSFYENMDEDDDDDDESFDLASSNAEKRSPTRRLQMRSTNHRPPPSKQMQQSNSMPTMGGNRTRDAALIAQTRHRTRRYNVFCRFLASSAELLHLDKMHGKCFLPVLQKLLVPTSSFGARQQRSLRSQQQQSQSRGTSYDATFLERRMDEIEHLRPFLEGLGPGAGLRCLAMLLLQHLLHSPEGYDARIRQALKTVGVLVLLHDLKLERQEEQQHADEQQQAQQQYSSLSVDDDSDGGIRSRQELEPADLVTLATRKFESLERFIALKLIELSKAQRELEERGGKREKAKSSGRLTSRGTEGSARDRIMRGLKIGGTAVAAGTLFAITGGLAAPGIAAGIAAIAGTTIVASAAAALTTTAAVTTIFGVGGGGLVAYKMQRRTIGLTEFCFCKETSSKRRKKKRQQAESSGEEDTPEAELFSTICISGWLRDDCDFQRPWGLSPSRPRIDDRLELLERFYSVHRPGHVPKSPKILASWKGEEEQLWDLLEHNYGRDPDHLFPLDFGPRFRGALSLEQKEVVDQILSELGCTLSNSGAGGEKQKRQQTPFERMQFGVKQGTGRSLSDSLHGPHADELNASSRFDDASTVAAAQDDFDISKTKHLATVWDYQATYGGELYTVRWESDLLEELCDSVTDLAAGVVTGATTHLLKFTALSALVAAMALPAALKTAANMIDGTWTLVVERSDEAGRELAQSLLFSSAGNRPVTLVGFSFGARVIYSCLKELARYQEKWEEYQERREQAGAKKERRQGGAVKEESDAFFENMREPASIVGDAIIMGLPNHLSLSSWQACRLMVAGRLVNCFSQKDLILSLMFQFKKFGLKPVCGTCSVNVAGVENIDVSDLVAGHQDYCLITGEILKRVRHGQPFAQSDAASLVLCVDGEEIR